MDDQADGGFQFVLVSNVKSSAELPAFDPDMVIGGKNMGLQGHVCESCSAWCT